MHPRTTRRDFLRQTALASVAVTLGEKLPAFAASPEPLLVKLSGEGVPKDVAGAVKKVLEPLGGMKAFVKRGAKVLLKPNIGFPLPPEQHATTSPKLVAAVAKEVLECGGSKVLILDHPTRRPEACMRAVGIQEAIRGLEVHFFLPTSEKLYVKTEVPQGKVLRRTDVLRDALEVDVHIALPIAKSHNAAGFTGTLKGMMGLILDRESFHSRLDLSQAIVDLNTVLQAQLVIMDGLKVMSTDGPAGPGELVTCNTLLAGTDAVAVDAAGVELAPLYGRNLKPRQIRHLKLAEQMGLGTLLPPADRVVSLEM